jgi:hypothetical protein
MTFAELAKRLVNEADDLYRLLENIEQMESDSMRWIALSMWKEAFASWLKTADQLEVLVKEVQG